MGSGDGGEQKLASSASDKQRAAKYMEEDLMPDTQAAARMGEGGGSVRPLFLAPAAPASPLMKQDTGLKGLSAWALDQGASDALIAWRGQANRLMGRLQQELNGLNGAKNTFQNQDTAIGTQADAVRLPSSFDGM
ncbi:hypothetical protein OIE62_26280 [Streptomyces scopuliridis]|uniref:Uncharacterized protein n=2 Tax=Streptomyces scopuliridis TaxID=452529 RepID=A0A2T7SMW9_9ACTN|nr:hypothetical protein [Streptomyces scopuliridis]PVE04189.1 hypothetical protein Y717_13220 [Streptomyces scopuliridis RB72]WSB33861.1 hypothetical protein OG949_13910 [Streptomyces scopuliridis]WSB98141.1 hypothetical protein OG835_14660 [Streptomyces scopuliridis]WSC08157.1 hypothetical protein OIE62_26280 [Streptomyces scopuliridis]